VNGSLETPRAARLGASKTLSSCSSLSSSPSQRSAFGQCLRSALQAPAPARVSARQVVVRSRQQVSAAARNMRYPAPIDVEKRASLIPDGAWLTPDSRPADEPIVGMAVVDGIHALLEQRVREAGENLPDWFEQSVVARFLEYQFLFTRVILVELRIARALAVLPGSSPQARYASFIALARTTAFRGYITQKYPVLEAYVVRQLKHYQRAAGTITSIIEAWRPGCSRSISSVQFVGDPHHDGRQGAIVSFADGYKVVVKPRSAAFDAYFADVVTLINPLIRASLRVARVEHVDDHVVSEWLSESQPAADSPYAFGAWLAIAQYHNLIDLHYENFIHTEVGPVPVDFECSFNPSVRVGRSRNTTEVRPAREPLWRAGLLPRASSDSGIELRWSPLADNVNRMAGAFQVVQLDGTDEAHLKFISDDGADSSLQSSVLASHADFEALGSGFVDAQQALAKSRSDLVSLRDSHRIDIQTTRVVRKPTRFYSDVLRRTFHPKFLVDPRSHIEAIRDLVERSGDTRDSVAGDFEVERLSAGFIPAYYSPVAHSGVLADGRVIDQTTVSGLTAHDSRLAELSDPTLMDLDRRTLRQMLVALSGPPWSDVESVKPPYAVDAQGPVAGLRSEVLGNLWTGNSKIDRVSWHNLVDAGNGVLTVEESAYDLYNGAAGSMLALLSAPQNIIDGELGERVLSDMLDNTLPWLRTSGRFGAYSGAAGAVYGVWNAEAHRLVRRADARTFSEEVLSECVRQCSESQEWDLFSGRAGLLLLLARLRDIGAIDPEWSRPLAAELITGLEETRLRSAESRGAWWRGPNMDGGIGGLAHGVSGVALATAHWPEFPLARELRESSQISQRQLRRGDALWADTRPYVERELADAWCHGAAGILLADRSQYGVTAPEDLRHWSSREMRDTDSDLTLCHGLAGQVLSGVTMLGSTHPYTIARAERLRGLVTDRWGQSGGHLIELSDSLFMGQAGALFALSICEHGERVGNPFLLSLPQERLASGGRA